MNLTILATLGPNFEMCSMDQSFFKSIVEDKTIVVSEREFYSLPFLKTTRYLVVSEKLNINYKNVLVFRNFANLIKRLKLINEEVFIVGSFNELLPFVNKMYIMFVRVAIQNSNSFFSKIKLEEWYENLIFQSLSKKIIEYKKKES